MATGRDRETNRGLSVYYMVLVNQVSHSSSNSHLLVLVDRSRSISHSDNGSVLDRLNRHARLQDPRGESTHLLILFRRVRLVETPLFVDMLMHGDLLAEKVGQHTKGREGDGDQPDETEREHKGVDDLGFEGLGERVEHGDGSIGAAAKDFKRSASEDRWLSCCTYTSGAEPNWAPKAAGSFFLS